MTRWQDVLRLHPKKRSQSTVRRCYDQWRKEHGIPARCDNPQCAFHMAPLLWNGRSLPLILDHIEGNRYDNLPSSLRYLCPNWDSQLSTRGGANRGRVKDVSENGYILKNRNGTTIAAATFRASGSSRAIGVGEAVVRKSAGTVAQQSVPADAAAKRRRG